MRINQYLAFCLGISRRQGDELIKEKKVKLNDLHPELFSKVEENDVVKTKLGQKWVIVKPKNLLTREGGKVVKIGQKVVVLMYKPIFCLTTRDQKRAFGLPATSVDKNHRLSKSKTEIKKGPRKTIYDFLPVEFRSLKPAGRLDYMSEGLLVLTNDGELINQLTMAKNNAQKTYLVGLKNQLSQDAIDQMQSGKLILDNYQLNKMLVDLLKAPQGTDLSQNLIYNSELAKNYNYLNLESNLFWYTFKLSEGRNRQIREVCQGFNQPVKRLIRVAQGQYNLTPIIKKQGFIIANS